MTKYSYEGVNQQGKTVSGVIEFSNENDLRLYLRQQRIRPKKIEKTKSASHLSKVSVPSQVLLVFTRQLQVLISAGVPLIQGLEVLIDQTHHAIFKMIIRGIHEKVSQGSYFWEALTVYSHVFPKIYVALIRAGESSGGMDGMLKRVSSYLETAEKTKKMIKSAMMYPIIVTVIGIAVVTCMLVFVIPKFESMLQGQGESLPLPTQILIDASHFLIRNVGIIFILFSFLSFFVYRYLKSEEGKAFLDRIVFRLPFFGTMVQKASVARFARTMQTLLVSGVNIIDSIDICKVTMDQIVLEEAVSNIRSQVETGKSLGSVMETIVVFPKMVTHMIRVGESTGNLDKMLEKIADFYEEEVAILISGISRLIEPLVIVFLGTLVGGIMIAMYLPIFKFAGGGN